MSAAAAYKLRARMEARPPPVVSRAAARQPHPPQRMRETSPRERASILWPQAAPMRVSSPEEPAEREAESTARTVMQMSAGRVWPPGTVARAAHRLHRSHGIHRQADGPRTADTRVSQEIEARLGLGAPLALDVREFMEPRFRADFRDVRIHTDAPAERLAARLNARAFTYGKDIFFARGQYRPDESAGAELLAHELTHTIQQQAVVQRSAEPEVKQRTPSFLQRLGLSDILDGLAELAANVPGFTLLTLIIGRNPINMRVVERNVVNLLRAFMGLIPGGEVLYQVLNRYGVVRRIAEWVDQQTAAMGLTFQGIRDAFTRFTDSLGFSDLFSPGDVWRRAQDIFTPTITRIRNFVSGLVTQAITWLKETFMRPLSDFCREIPGYGIVKVMLGRDPFTNAAVPRSALNVVRAFAEFIPGGTEKVDQLVQSRALERAFQWFTTETQARNLTWERITGTFARAWDSLQLEDVLHPIDTLQRMIGLFRPLLTDLVGFARAALMKLAEMIFEAAMGAGGARIVAIFKRARDTFNVIIADPVRFLRHLLNAVGQGVRQFMNNILRHLRDGVIAWLTGPVARAGIQMPEQWDLRGIIWFVLQILGLTWPNIRRKLVRLMGERPVAVLEAGFQLLQEIRERGLVQALRDRVTEFFGQLREAALGGIKSFIQQRLVMAGIQQLISLLSPVGAIIQAIIKTYTTIKFFIDKINEILDLVESIVNSIAAIAAGQIAAAANFVERTMARTIPIILDFLARFIGLGNVGEQVQTTIRGLQARVDQMLDRAVDWIRRQAARLGSAVASGARSVARRIAGWWQTRKEFRNRRGESHALYFQGTAANARLIMATDPVPLETYLNSLPDSPQVRAARDTYNRQVVSVIRRRGTDEEKLQLLTEALNALSAQLAAIDGVTAANLPTQPLASYPNPKPVEVKLSRLHIGNKPTGSRPTLNTPAYQIIQRNRDKLAERWVQMHLVNDTRFGGPGTSNNLVPGPQSLNDSTQMRGFDSAVSTIFEQVVPGGTAAQPLRNVIWIKANVTYHSGASRIVDTDGTFIDWSHFAQSIALQSGLNAMERGSNTWNVETAARVRANIRVPRPDFNPAISLGTATRTVLERSGIAVFSHPTYGSDLRNFIRDRQPFASYGALRAQLDEVAADPGRRRYRTIDAAAVNEIYNAIQAAQRSRLLRL